MSLNFKDSESWLSWKSYTNLNSFLLSTNSADRTASIERIKLIIGLESESDLSILSSTANGIVENIKLKVWTATLVLKAYIRRAIAVQEMCNPLTEIMFDSALEQAALLDEEFFRTGTIVGRCKIWITAKFREMIWD